MNEIFNAAQIYYRCEDAFCDLCMGTNKLDTIDAKLNELTRIGVKRVEIKSLPVWAI